MVLERPLGPANMIDVLERVLDKGIVVDAWLRLSFIGISLMTVEARVLVASIETYMRHATVVGQLGPLAAPPHESAASLLGPLAAPAREPAASQLGPLAAPARKPAAHRKSPSTRSRELRSRPRH